ncbi:MAG TPA: alanine racemase [Alphaproteobacteria bacterium]|nr:alanine racemase [Alphaproteobacteria bacterium]
MKSSERFGGRLTINLDAVAANYRLLKSRAAPAECAVAVKANAYGLGVDRVAPTLWNAGCRTFFVATLDEAIELRGILPEAKIYVLNGLPRDEAPAFREYKFCPVLNDLPQIEAWTAFSRKHNGQVPPAGIHIDTGMNRLGLPPQEAETLLASPELLENCPFDLIMSHLACADEPAHPKNQEQCKQFASWTRRFPGKRASLANSAGVFLGKPYHHDLVRVGISVYGGAPVPSAPNPMAEVVNLQGRIVQTRFVDSPMTVGYGATHSFKGRTRLATVALGYGDGYMRSAGNHAYGCIDGVRVPVVGRVSMDLTTLDITAVRPDSAQTGDLIDMIGHGANLDEIARLSGTVSYEVLTNLGSRYERIYIGGAADGEVRP